MTFLKVMIVLTFFVLGGYYLTHMDDVNNGTSKGITTATDYFIDKSDQIITVVDLWANGPPQNYATSGSENIVFTSDEPAQISGPMITPKQPQENETIIVIDEVNMDELNMKQCEKAFKSCVDSAHEQYGVYITVNEVRTFDDDSAIVFYNGRKSDYQPEFNQATANYPLILVHAKAEGLGQFVAICKNGEYPKDLNSGLPC